MASIRPLKSRFLSVDDLRRMNLPDSFIEDYLNIGQNFQIIGSQFQALKSGTQATTGAFAALEGWTQERNQSGFQFDPITGELTIQETGEYLIDAHVFSDGTTGIEAKLQLWTGSSWDDVAGSLTGNSTSCNINGILVSCSLSYKVRLVVRDTGGAVNIDSDCARLTIGRRS